MDTAQIHKIISNFYLFRHLEEEELNQIVEISITREWRKGNHIFLQGEPIKNVYFIQKGEVKIYRCDIDGKEQIVNFLKNGDMFPHVGFFRKGSYPANAEVQSDTATIIVIPISQFEKVLIANPKLCIKVFHILQEKIVELQERLESHVLNNTQEQIIKLLVQLGKTHGLKKDEMIYLKMELTNRDLANMIGTSRETVSRTLAKLKREGHIHEKDGTLSYNPKQLLDLFF